MIDDGIADSVNSPDHFNHFDDLEEPQSVRDPKNLSKAEGKYGSSGVNSLNPGPPSILVSPWSKIPSKVTTGKFITDRELTTMSQAAAPKRLKSFDNFEQRANILKTSSNSLTNMQKGLLFESVLKLVNRRFQAGLSHITAFSKAATKKRVRPLELNYSDCSPIIRDHSSEEILDSNQQDKEKLQNNFILENLSPFRNGKGQTIPDDILVPNVEERSKELNVFDILSPVVTSQREIDEKDRKNNRRLVNPNYRDNWKDEGFESNRVLGSLDDQDQNVFGMANARKWITNAHMLARHVKGHSKQASVDRFELKTLGSRLDLDSSPIREATKHLNQMSRDLQRSMDRQRSVTLDYDYLQSALKTFLSNNKKYRLTVNQNELERRTAPIYRTSIFQPIAPTPKNHIVQEIKNSGKILMNIPSKSKSQNKNSSKEDPFEASDKKNSHMKNLSRSKNSRNNSRDKSSVQNYLQNAKLQGLLKTTDSSHKKKT